MRKWGEHPNDGKGLQRISKMLKDDKPAPVLTNEMTEMLRAAREAADFLAELYAKYSTKVGPFASQAQRINGALQRAIHAVQQAESQSEPSEPLAYLVTDTEGLKHAYLTRDEAEHAVEVIEKYRHHKATFIPLYGGSPLKSGGES